MKALLIVVSGIEQGWGNVFRPILVYEKDGKKKVYLKLRTDVKPLMWVPEYHEAGLKKAIEIATTITGEVPEVVMEEETH